MPETTQPSSHDLARRMTEFPARLSPMLVKELRQGMRTHLFAVAFVLLQGFMILCVLAGMAEPGSSQSDWILWLVVALTLLGVQPLRGLNSLSAEHRLNTLDLIRLTRLNAWRIVLGKWTALNAQSLLLLTAVLPYLVIRYFFGGVDFISDLIVLLLFGLGSALTTAATVGCSVFPNLLVRIALAIALGIGLLVLTEFVSSPIFGGSSAFEDPTFLGLLGFAALYGCFFFLSFGASRIAPLSENHATRKRLFALAAAVACQGFLFLDLEEPVAFLTAAILALACVDALTEPSPHYSSVLRPFAKDPLTRVTALFLSPGWIGGLGFFVVAACLYYGSIEAHDFISTRSNTLKDPEDLTVFLSACNIVIFPLLLIHLFFRRYARDHFTFALYVFIQIGVWVVTAMVASIGEMIHGWEAVIYLACPLPSVIMVGLRNVVDVSSFFFVSLITTLLCLFVPVLRHREDWREFRKGLSSRAASTPS